jgi:molybdate transport system substrate-binding protein
VFGTRFSYAIGELLLWARNVEGEGESCVDAFLEDRSSKVAIANPDTAPYGTAAKQYLVAAELWDDVSPRLVTGENIAQAFQFVSRGGAGFGFIAGAQRHALPAKACTWPVPVTLFDPIRQQAVLLNRAAEKQAAQAFMSFLQGGSARSIIVADAYAVEESSGE